MIFFLLILAIAVIKSTSVTSDPAWKTEYISRDHSNAIKGIFVILVFLSHVFSQTALSGPFDQPYIEFKDHLDQMVVVMFLFYSGYGMMESIKRKGYDYVKGIPSKRLLRVFVNFVIALVLFLITDVCIGNPPKITTFLLSLIGWESIGNSNWYMFVIFALYILMFLAFQVIIKKNSTLLNVIGAVIFSILSVGLILFLLKMGKRPYFYDTIPSFVLGVWYSLLHKKIEDILFRYDIVFAIACLATAALYFYTFPRRDHGLIMYPLWEVSFVVAVILFTMKFKVSSRMLTWFGAHIFPVYILQRIPMLVLNRFGLNDSRPYAYIILVFICTLSMALVFELMTGKLWSGIDKKRLGGRA